MNESIINKRIYPFSSYQTNFTIEKELEIKRLPCEFWTPDRRIFSAMEPGREKLITDLHSGSSITYRKLSSELRGELK